MIDVQHKILKSIKENIGEIAEFFGDIDKIKRIMDETKTIDSWNNNDKVKMYQSITEDILNNCDINEVLDAFVSLRLFGINSLDVDIFKSVAYDYYLFLKRVYDVYLLDQIYYLLASDMDFTSCSFDKPFNTNSYYESINFGISFFQTSLNSNNEDADVRLYNLKTYYLELINGLFRNKKYLYRKAELNRKLQEIVFSSDNYYASQLFIMLNADELRIKPKRNTRKAVPKDEMQLVLEKF